MMTRSLDGTVVNPGSLNVYDDMMLVDRIGGKGWKN